MADLAAVTTAHYVAKMTHPRDRDVRLVCFVAVVTSQRTFILDTPLTLITLDDCTLNDKFKPSRPDAGYGEYFVGGVTR